MQYNVDYEICTIVFLLMLILFSSTRRKLEGFQSRAFNLYLATSFANLCLDIITCYTIACYKSVPLWINILLNGIFLMLQFCIPAFFMLYVYFKIKRIDQKKNRMPWIAIAPAAIGVVLAATSSFTGWVFYFDNTGYHHGSFHIFLYINAALYSIGTVIYILTFYKKLKWRQAFTYIFMIVVAIIPTIIQLFVPSYMLSGIGTALSVFIMYLTSENTVLYIDSTTGALNRDAFFFHLTDSYRNEIPEQIFVIALDNFKIVNEMFGLDGGNELMRQLVTSLQREYSDSVVYRFEGDTFAIILEEQFEGTKELDRIRKVIGKTYILHGAVVELSACIVLLHTNNHGQEELVQAIEYATHQAKLAGKGQFIEVDEKVEEDIIRRKAIEQAMVTAIDSGHFEVHYQPIYDTRKKCFHSMEALARLNVPDYGYVSPEEFIRIAEQNGTIIQIGIIVLEEVCRFITECKLREKGIKFVEVNLSVVQCTKERIYKDIQSVLDKYHVPMDMINLEITESAAAYSEERLIRNMARMSLMGLTFSLDDYGSGYSNINYLVDLPFSIVKIDKYVVWAAMKKVSSRVILEHTIAMFKDINLKVVTEGIESLEMAEMITGMGADYLQGYYYSKPVTKEKLLECLEEGYLENLRKK